MAVEVGGMKQGDGDGMAFIGEELAGEGGEKCTVPEGAKEPASTERGREDVHGMSVGGRSSALKPETNKKYETALDKEGRTGFFRGELYQGLTMSNGPGPGSAGNVIAAICSFFIPGLGQLVQGRPLIAAIQFVLAAILWIILLGWVIHLWSILDAALYRGR